jgi:hypothetical protein
MNRHASTGDRNAQRRQPGREDNPRDCNGERNGGAPAPRRRLSGSAAAEYAKAHLLDLTGQPCEAVSSLSRTRDGWRVVLEIVELERIPRTTDILASYRVDLDEDGELMGYERIHRYCRNDVDGAQ